MSKPQKNRITTAPQQNGLNTAFAVLSSDGLPDGPADAPARQTHPARGRRGRVVLRKERAHRGGKTVIVADDFAPHISAAEIEELGRVLRKACGVGGTVRGRAIEIQGDHAAKVRHILESEGFKVAGI